MGRNYYKRHVNSLQPGICHTQPSPKVRALKKSAVQVLSFGEDLGEAKRNARVENYVER